MRLLRALQASHSSSGFEPEMSFDSAKGPSINASPSNVCVSVSQIRIAFQNIRNLEERSEGRLYIRREKLPICALPSLRLFGVWNAVRDDLGLRLVLDTCPTRDQLIPPMASLAALLNDASGPEPGDGKEGAGDDGTWGDLGSSSGGKAVEEEGDGGELGVTDFDMVRTRGGKAGVNASGRHGHGARGLGDGGGLEKGAEGEGEGEGLGGSLKGLDGTDDAHVAVNKGEVAGLMDDDADGECDPDQVMEDQTGLHGEKGEGDGMVSNLGGGDHLETHPTGASSIPTPPEVETPLDAAEPPSLNVHSEYSTQVGSQEHSEEPHHPAEPHGELLGSSLPEANAEQEIAKKKPGKKVSRPCASLLEMPATSDTKLRIHYSQRNRNPHPRNPKIRKRSSRPVPSPGQPRSPKPPSTSLLDPGPIPYPTREKREQEMERRAWRWT